MTRITQIVQTCYSSPSQWEDTLADGRWVYVRFRWGHLRVLAGKNLFTDDAEVLLDWHDDNEINGYLTYDQLRSLLAVIGIETPLVDK